MEILKEWEDKTMELAEYFVNKYFGKDEEFYFVSDEVEGVLCVNDYFFDLEFIITALRYKATEKQLFDFYDMQLDYSLKEKPMKTNFRNFVRYNIKLN